MTMGITSPTSTTGQILKDGTPVISFDANNNATFAGTVVSNTPLGMRNRIINGDMRIDQRNNGSSVTNSAGATTYTLDRWALYGSQTSKFSVQQNAGSVTPPAGFTNYLGVTSLSAYSVGASELFVINQRIEGYNLADFSWGTADAKTITISFWVRSSLTGTFGGVLQNSAQNRNYPFSYSISSANTWEQKTITVTGDTTGTWLTTNGIGLRVSFSIGVGSTLSGTAGAWSATEYYSATGATSVVGTNGATWYITGVQLEVGSTATPFERRLYGQELVNCQRYYYRLVNGTVSNIRYVLYAAYNATRVFGQFSVPVAMRTSSPAGSFGSGTYVVLEKPDLTASYPITAFSVYSGTLSSNTNMMGMEINVASGLTANSLYYLTLLGGGAYSTAYVDLSAEL